MTSNPLLTIERIEPPFWYVGMHNPILQILCYGKNIAKLQVSISNSTPITKVQRTENPNYLFITINTKNSPPTEFHFIFKEKDKVVLTQKYSLKQRKEHSAQRKSFDASDVMYLFDARSFFLTGIRILKMMFPLPKIQPKITRRQTRRRHTRHHRSSGLHTRTGSYSYLEHATLRRQ